MSDNEDDVGYDEYDEYDGWGRSEFPDERSEFPDDVGYYSNDEYDGGSAFDQQWGRGERSESPDEYEGTNFEASWAQTQHSSKASVLFGTTVFGEDLKKGMRNVSPEDRFRIKVNSESVKLKNMRYVDDKDIKDMLELSTKIDVKHLNPTAYIMGYIATKYLPGSKTKNSVEFVIKKVLPQANEDDGVQPPDVIRYFRLLQRVK